MPPEIEPRLDALLDAALPHVPFDGWTERTFEAAARDAGLSREEARALAPKGAIDLAAAFHRRGDAAMARRLAREPLEDMRVRARIAFAVRARIEAIGDREAARRAAAAFALPQNAARGARLIWDTSDAIWTALSDPSDDINWYTKRATLAGVYASAVLFWLGDDSEGNAATWDFVDRRIEDVMRIERAKGAARSSKLFSALWAGPAWALGHVRAPMRMPRGDMPGVWAPSEPAAPGADPAPGPRAHPEEERRDGEGPLAPAS